jgi:hypothetical protein
MTVERALRLIAGAIVLASTLAAAYIDIRFLWVTAFVGVNLLQSGFTNWCPMMTVLRKAGMEAGR